MIEICDAYVDPDNTFEFLLFDNSSFFKGLLFLSSDLFIAVTPLPPILNLFENLLLLLRLNYGIYLLDVNLPGSLYYICFFFLTTFLSGVTVRLFSFTTSLIVFNIVENKYFELTIEFQFYDAKIWYNWLTQFKLMRYLLMLKTIKSRLSKNGISNLSAFSFQSIFICS